MAGSATPYVQSSEVFVAELVIQRLEEAGQTLLCLPHSGYTTGLRLSRLPYMPEVVESSEDQYGVRARLPIPEPASITRMDQALAWVPLIPADKLVLRRVVGCRALVSPLTGRHLYSWRRIARLIGSDHKAVQRWHGAGIDHIVAALNSPLTTPGAKGNAA